jgi:hypothetical protein
LIRLIFLFLFLLPVKLFCQQSFNGKFCTSENDPVGYCFTFNKDSTFEYKSGSCYGEYIGQGKFIDYKDSIVLNFMAEDTFKEYIVERIFPSHNKEFINLNFIVLDFKTKLPVDNVSVYYEKSRYDKISSKTDSAGKTNLKLPSGNIPITLNSRRYKNLPFEFEIIPDSNKEIIIYFDTRNNEYIGNVNITLKMNKRDNTTMQFTSILTNIPVTVFKVK